MSPESVPPGVELAEIERAYRRGYGRFLRLGMAILGDADRARDVVQEAFARAIRARSTFRGGSLEGWIWRTLLRLCLEEKRSVSAVSSESIDFGDQGEPVAWPEVRAAIAELPERERVTLFLRHYADLDYEQIAEVLGVARGTVAAALHAAHAKVRTAITEVPQ